MKIELSEVAQPAEEIPTAEGLIVLPGQRIEAHSVEVDPAEIAALLATAREAATRAYAPFSKFRVGAAVVMADDPEGTAFSGSNVENSSYGATNCAERTAIFQASAAGFRTIRLIALTTLDSLDGPLRDRSPCGICRQVIREFGDAETLVAIDTGDEGTLCELLDVERLLPYGFRFGGG